MSRSTAVNLPEDSSRGPVSLNVTPVRFPLKPAVNAMFTVNESIYGLLESGRPTKFSNCDLWNKSRTATSVEEFATGIWLSEIRFKDWTYCSWKKLDQLVCMLGGCTLKCIKGRADWIRGLTGRTEVLPQAIHIDFFKRLL